MRKFDLLNFFYGLGAANPELGEVAVELSNPSRLTGQRSTSADRDGFAYFGFIATLKL